MEYNNKTKAKKDTGLSYLGSVNLTVKHKKAFKYGEMTYSLYLAPGNMSGYEVCPGRTTECTALCLNNSGHNIGAMNGDFITMSRIIKTKLFFEHKDYFMKWTIEEIESAKNKAKKLGYSFSVRLNNTSDISPEAFHLTIDGVDKNIMEIFSDVQFYDYSKVPSRHKLLPKYQNYNLTFSYTGLNE